MAVRLDSLRNSTLHVVLHVSCERRLVSIRLKLFSLLFNNIDCKSLATLHLPAAQSTSSEFISNILAGDKLDAFPGSQPIEKALMHRQHMWLAA